MSLEDHRQLAAAPTGAYRSARQFGEIIMRLSPSQIQHFQVFGFLCLRSIFSTAEMTRLSASADAIFEEDCQEHPFTGVERQQIQGFVERCTALTDLIDDDRVLGTVEELLGSDLVWVGSDGNRYVGQTGWHPDGSNLSLPRMKTAFYLDPLTRATGALRVIPGSHLDPLHHALRILLQRDDATITPYGVRASVRGSLVDSGYGVAPEEVPCHAVETKPGDVVFFDQNVWHASFGGHAGRRMFTLNFAVTPTDEAHWDFLKRMYSGQLDYVRTRQFGKRQLLFGDPILQSRRPKVARLIDPIARLGFR